VYSSDHTHAIAVLSLADQPDVKTVWGTGLSGYTVEARLIEEKLSFEASPAKSGNPKVLAPVKDAFSASGGLKLLSGNLGKSVTAPPAR